MNPVTHYLYECPELELVAFDCPRVSRMLRPWEVYLRTTLSPSHSHRLMAQGRFPRFGPVAVRSRGLPEHVLDAFLAERMAARVGLAPLGSRPLLCQWRFDVAKVPGVVGIRLLRRVEVLALCGLSKSALHRLVERGLFPAPVPLGPRASRWVAHEVEAWVRGHARCAPVAGSTERVDARPGVSS